MPHPTRKPWLIWLPRTFRTLICLAVLPSTAVQAQQPDPPVPTGHGSYTALHLTKKRRLTADHSKFKILQGPFKEGDGPAVTRACLTCHTKAAEQVMATSHWTWNVAKDGKDGYGKSTHLVNNYCISIIGGNTESCARCHAG